MAEMTAEDVLWFLREMRALDIAIWIDGGWGVDALLGQQTRRHDDLDIVIEERHCAAAVAFLESRGYRDLPRDDSRPCNFVLGDDAGREIDFHVVALDEEGNGHYGPAEAREGLYPSEALRGAGRIAGEPVACTSAAYQMRAHRGYAFDEKDVRDVTALAEAFDLALPGEYRAAARQA